MTLLQITAILSLLLSFGVDVKIVENIRTIITPSIASTTLITTVPVIQTPIVENAPVYFGSTNVVQSPTVEPAVIKEIVAEISGNGVIASYKENGKKLPNVPITFSAPSGKFMFGGLNEPGSNAGKFLNPTTLPTSPESTGERINTAFVSYYPDTTVSPMEKPVDDNNNWVSEEGGMYYPGALITVSALGVTKTIQSTPVYKVKKVVY